MSMYDSKNTKKKRKEYQLITFKLNLHLEYHTEIKDDQSILELHLDPILTYPCVSVHLYNYLQAGLRSGSERSGGSKSGDEKTGAHTWRSRVW